MIQAIDTARIKFIVYLSSKMPPHEHNFGEDFGFIRQRWYNEFILEDTVVMWYYEYNTTLNCNLVKLVHCPNCLSNNQFIRVPMCSCDYRIRGFKCDECENFVSAALVDVGADECSCDQRNLPWSQVTLEYWEQLISRNLLRLLNDDDVVSDNDDE